MVCMRAALLATITIVIAGCPAVYGQAGDPCAAASKSLLAHDLEAARSGYENCLKDAPPTPERLSNLGMAYAGLNQFDRAIPIYRQALALKPDDATLHMNLGLALLKSGEVKDAAKQFSLSLLTDGGNLKALELLAFCHLQMNEIELAASEVEPVHLAQPDDDSASLILGTCFLRLGRYKEAIPLLYFSMLKANVPQTHQLLGEAFLGVKAYNNALKEFLSAQAALPSLAGLANDLGTSYAGLGQPDKAAGEFQKQLAVDPDDFEANYYMGRLKRLANETEAAKQFLAKADRARPGDPSVSYEYAVFAMGDKDYAKAEERLHDILDKVPNYLDAHVLLAEVDYKLHKPDEARRERAIVEALQKQAQEEENASGKPPEPRTSAKPAGP
jgi:tetratricopeptide (TPR) repeat protein